MSEGESSPVRRVGTREKMVRTAAEQLGTSGVAGTSIDRVLSVSGAPRGSVYHHFPGGRAELLSEGVEYAAELIVGVARGTSGSGPGAVATPEAALDAFMGFWRRLLLDSDFRAGCPVLAVTVDPDPALPDLTERAGAVFGRWQEELSAMLADGGMTTTSADRLAMQSLCVLEGAVAVCRARREIAPLDAAADAIRALFELEVSVSR